MPLHRPFDEILDIYVRDGLVYYHALKQERAQVRSLRRVAWRRDRRRAQELAAAIGSWRIWINAYNAFVLRTVIDNYPIRGEVTRLSAEQHPADSRRVRAPHRSAPAGAC